MKCTRCGTNVDREATDRGICFDCYCELDLIAYNEHLKLNPARKYLEEE
jgi:NMD protein affecting ribosome stability and mRNA decay